MSFKAVDFVMDKVLQPNTTLNHHPASVRAMIAQGASGVPEIPAYLQDTYYWAYLDPRNVSLLDREFVVKVMLWGQHRRLRQSAFDEIPPGQSVLQSGHVYGEFSPALARHLGPDGRLDVIDIAPIQVANCRRKLAPYPYANAYQADAARLRDKIYDTVCCYFLLHELPEDYKYAVVNTLLSKVAPGGRVVFVDYHKPHGAHPLKPLINVVFDRLEPFAKGLWHTEIEQFAAQPDRFNWRKETYFGGFFQKVVAEREV